MNNTILLSYILLHAAEKYVSKYSYWFIGFQLQQIEYNKLYKKS